MIHVIEQEHRRRAQHTSVVGRWEPMKKRHVAERHARPPQKQTTEQTIIKSSHRRLAVRSGGVGPSQPSEHASMAALPRFTPRQSVVASFEAYTPKALPAGFSGDVEMDVADPHEYVFELARACTVVSVC